MKLAARLAGLVRAWWARLRAGKRRHDKASPPQNLYPLW